MQIPFQFFPFSQVFGQGNCPTQKKRGGETYMKLLTEEIKAKIPALYSQENKKDPMVICKFFDPVGSWTWFVTEGEENGDGDFEFFGLVIGFEAELGYFTLSQLETAKQGITGIKALPIERDLYFTPCKLSEAKKQYMIEHGKEI